MENWNGLISPVKKEEYTEQNVFPNRVSYIDNLFTAGYNQKELRLITPITIQDCKSNNSPHIMLNKAIWDTGATTSCISAEIAKREGLQPIDEGIINTIAGNTKSLIYMINVRLGDEIIIPDLKVFGFPAYDNDREFIIGMDIISKGNLTIANKKERTEISFEMNLE